MEELEFVEQEYIPLREATFIIPLRIETDDRMRNIITTLIFLLRGFDTTVIVKEFDSVSTFEQSVLPQLKEALTEDQLKNLTHVFEQTDEYIFHRTRLINDMVLMSKTPVVVNYDSDILLPKTTYVQAVDLILNGFANPNFPNAKPEPIKVVYPYGYGDYQRQVFYDDEQASNFINSNFNFLVFTNTRPWDAKFGFCQFFDREEYIRLGMENENFVSYGYEDDERYNRFNQLSHVARIDETVYHLEHKRTSNSWFNNPHIEENRKLFEYLSRMSPDKILEYYTNQSYMANRGVIHGKKIGG
jgi:predicted glycosyltransferase involved in capsule biosynthesis